MAEWVRKVNGEFNQDYVILPGDEARRLVRHYAADLDGTTWRRYRNSTRKFTFENPTFAEMMEAYLEEGEAINHERSPNGMASEYDTPDVIAKYSKQLIYWYVTHVPADLRRQLAEVVDKWMADYPDAPSTKVLRYWRGLRLSVGNDG